MKSIENAKKRVRIFAFLRRFFTEREFLEVDTPLLVRLPGMEPYLDPFQTEFVSVFGERNPMYLITSPEYAMKKLLAAGYERIFQLGKCFRNKETGSDLHNPEFTLLEWYRIHANYEDLMRDTADLLRFLAGEIFGGSVFSYQGKKIDVSHVEIFTMQEIFQKYTGIGREDFEDEKRFFAYFELRYRSHHIPDRNFQDLFFLVFLNEIERHLGFPHPVIVKDYPACMAALSKVRGNYAERFELYIAGMELANAFSELTDGIEQRRRLEEERVLRRQLDKLDYPVDEKFIEAVSRMPESAGIALGADRLIMLFLDVKNIGEVAFFPFGEL